MRRNTWVLVSGLFLFSMVFACTRYPSIPEREKMEQPRAPARRAVRPPAERPVAPPVGFTKDYRIGPEDVLEIKVWDHDDLSRDVHISQNGDFSYPLIGTVRAAGKTAAQVEREMTRRLADGYLVKPQVTVNVKEFRSQKVYVMGEVTNPGTFPLTGPTSVTEILTRAGGHTQEAGTEVLVIRPREKARRGAPLTLEEAREGEVIRLDLLAIEHGDVSHNIRLQNGDTVMVPKAKYFYVFGEVKSPGKFKHEPGITVLKAITLAGGITEKAAAKRTKILREKAGVRVEIPAKVNTPVEPNDIVMVPESFF